MTILAQRKTAKMQVRPDLIFKPDTPTDFQYFLDENLVTLSTLDLLWYEIIIEVLKGEQGIHDHHKISNYTRGCRGPLCTKARRDHARISAERSGKKPNAKRSEYDVTDPFTEYYYLVLKTRITLDRKENHNNVPSIYYSQHGKVLSE